MTASPYDTIGVAKGATEEEIRKAYRKKAKATHPDRGGSPEEFTTLTTALLVLLDPARGEKFDRTGEVDGDVFNPEQEALAVATNAVITAVAEAGNRDVSFINLLTMARQKVEQQRSEILRVRAEIKKGVGMLEKAARRFAKKTGTPGPDWVAAVFTGQINLLMENDKSNEKNLGIVERAKGLLEFYEYIVDQPPASDFLQTPQGFAELFKNLR